MFDGGSCRTCDTRPSQAKKCEKTISAIIKAIQNFMDPFQVEMDDKLDHISSDAAVLFNIESNIINAKLSGTAAKKLSYLISCERMSSFLSQSKG